MRRYDVPKERLLMTGTTDLDAAWRAGDRIKAAGERITGDESSRPTHGCGPRGTGS